jgi:hypothetical protein
MSLRTQTIRPGFVAGVGGIDISAAMSPTAMAALWDVSDARAVFSRPDSDRYRADCLRQEFWASGRYSAML